MTYQDLCELLSQRYGMDVVNIGRVSEVINADGTQTYMGFMLVTYKGHENLLSFNQTFTVRELVNMRINEGSCRVKSLRGQ